MGQRGPKPTGKKDHRVTLSDAVWAWLKATGNASATVEALARQAMAAE